MAEDDIGFALFVAFIIGCVICWQLGRLNKTLKAIHFMMKTRFDRDFGLDD